ncbi:BolA family protein [Buchnera aphidicola]|uniref:BolA family transcriptional regulator n=1 Tax=Buchnera aphidicola (Artemisaphis artemisicola) TaxID=1241836 RepID=A0A4D6XLH3_9GAMM|nr:BolA/IbaG family iron-sulfur metabolism protein [Buchnera aphidicola]QCI16127.1 BolA family transcriptional regulator [Buchnera aphidicola (Artemisaphis artemisicola)]
MILKKIKNYLKSQIKITFIKINNNSHLHHNLKKSFTHLSIIIISNDFINQKTINRHRIIFSKISQIIKEKIYSITLHAYTENEWKARQYKINENPECFKGK